MKTISTSSAPAALGPYAQAQISGGFVFTSGQVGINPATGAAVPAVLPAIAVLAGTAVLLGKKK